MGHIQVAVLHGRVEALPVAPSFDSGLKEAVNDMTEIMADKAEVVPPNNGCKSNRRMINT